MGSGLPLDIDLDVASGCDVSVFSGFGVFSEEFVWLEFAGGIAGVSIGFSVGIMLAEVARGVTVTSPPQARISKVSAASTARGSVACPNLDCINKFLNMLPANIARGPHQILRKRRASAPPITWVGTNGNCNIRFMRPPIQR